MENNQEKKGRNKQYDYIAVPILVVFIVWLVIWMGYQKPTKSLVSNTNQKTSTAAQNAAVEADPDVVELEKQVVPEEGVELPISWEDLGKRMVDEGVIDQNKFEALYARRGGLDANMQSMLSGSQNEKVVMTNDNAGVILNLLWALGLGNKNSILENGPMVKKEYGGAGNFASTGGWDLSKGQAMDHYSKHNFIVLTPAQQTLVEKVSKNIYRPCCGNSTYFPDCNHGMAMLALLELMAKQGVNESEMYKVALKVNSYWFTENYLTIARYFKEQKVEWKDVDAKKALSQEFSSGNGYQSLLEKVDPVSRGKQGGSCGV